MDRALRGILFPLILTILFGAYRRAEAGTNPFEPFIGEYQVAEILKSERNGAPHDFAIFRVKVGYEARADVPGGKVLVLKHWAKPPSGGILSQPLVSSEMKAGGGEDKTEVVGLVDGARATRKTSYDGSRSILRVELHGDGDGPIRYRFAFEDHHWRYGDDRGEVQLLLKRVRFASEY